MPDIKTKVSLYFPKDLFKKFEKLRTEKEKQLGVSLSKNEFALKLIADAIVDLEKEEEIGVHEPAPVYFGIENDVRILKGKVDSLENEINQLKKELKNLK